MAFLFGGGSQAKQTPAVSGLQIQTSAYGKAIPIVYGATRVAPNLIWYGNFQAIPQSQSGAAGKGGVGGGGGGKGGGGGVSYQYQTGVMLAVCEGPISGIDVAYVGKNITTPAALGFTTFDGTYPQTPWGFLAANSGAITEAHQIPAVSPYTVAVNNASGFLQDYGVATPAVYVPLTKVTGSPAPGQYALLQANLYSFNAAQLGAQVTIQYVDVTGHTQSYAATVPAANSFGYYLVSVYGTAEMTDQGVTLTRQPLTSATGAPAPGQYAVSGGVYTFNAANAGGAVNISYTSTTQANPFQAYGYNGVAYVANSAYQLGSSPQLPNHNFEVLGVYFATAPNGPGDADPSLVVADLLTNPHYGAGFPSARLGSVSTYQAYCLANGLWISPAYTQQAQASSMLDEIAVNTNSAFVWSSGQLTLVPYGDQAVTANGYTYTPPSSPLYSLADDDFLPNSNATGGNSSSNNDPVLLTRKRPADALNSIKLEYLDRTEGYNPAIIEAKDQALINVFGLRQAASQQAHLFCDGNAARLSVQLRLQRQGIRNVYQFTLDQRYILLDPMDIVAISDSNLGLASQWVRITEITENNDGTLSFVAEEYLAGTGNAPAYAFQAAQGFSANYNSNPGPTNAPVIFEPTAELAEALEVWLGVSGGPNWGGADVWISNDGATYRLASRVSGPNRTGVLTAALPAVAGAATGQTIDQANTLAANLSQSGGQLLSTTQQQATSLATLCYVDGEYVAYQNAALTGPNAYALTYLIRGCYGSPISAHAVGGKFLRLDDGILKIPFTQDQIGSTIYVKFLSFNVYGGGQYQLGNVNPFAYTLQGTTFTSPLPNVTNLHTSYVGNVTQLTWNEVTDFRAVLYEVRKGAGWLGAQQFGRVAHPPFTIQGNGTYWVSAYSQPVAGLQVYSQAAQEIIVTGGTIVSNVIATWDEAAAHWPGACSGDAVVITGNLVSTGGSGNLLTAANVLTIGNILAYGGEGNGVYTIPASHVVNIGRVAPCNVLLTWTSYGQNVNDNILTVANILATADFLDYASSALVTVYPEIALSPDGSTWAAWQKWSPGAYSAKAFQARMQLQTNDPAVAAYLSAMTFAVDVPNRDDHYINQPAAAGGTTITFTPDGSPTPTPFKGGPSGASGSANLPAVQVTILNAQQGDTAVVSGLSLSSCTVQVLNGGAGVTRTINLLAEGY